MVKESDRRKNWSLISAELELDQEIIRVKDADVAEAILRAYSKLSQDVIFPLKKYNLFRIFQDSAEQEYAARMVATYVIPNGIRTEIVKGKFNNHHGIDEISFGTFVAYHAYFLKSGMNDMVGQNNRWKGYKIRVLEILEESIFANSIRMTVSEEREARNMGFDTSMVEVNGNFRVGAVIFKNQKKQS